VHHSGVAIENQRKRLQKTGGRLKKEQENEGVAGEKPEKGERRCRVREGKGRLSDELRRGWSGEAQEKNEEGGKGTPGKQGKARWPPS